VVALLAVAEEIKALFRMGLRWGRNPLVGFSSPSASASPAEKGFCTSGPSGAPSERVS